MNPWAKKATSSPDMVVNRQLVEVKTMKTSRDLNRLFDSIGKPKSKRARQKINHAAKIQRRLRKSAARRVALS